MALEPPEVALGMGIEGRRFRIRTRCLPYTLEARMKGRAPMRRFGPETLLIISEVQPHLAPSLERHLRHLLDAATPQVNLELVSFAWNKSATDAVVYLRGDETQLTGLIHDLKDAFPQVMTRTR